MPFIMQAVKRGESMVICDSKAEFYEMYSEYLRNEGYFVRAITFWTSRPLMGGTALWIPLMM